MTRARDPKVVRQRINRVAGQVAGLQKMVEEGRYCIDILTQVSAARAALDAFAVAVLCDHVDHCLDPSKAGAHPQSEGQTREALIEELRDSLTRLVR